MGSEFRTFFGVSQNNYTLQLSSQRQCPFSKIHQASSVSKLTNYHPVDSVNIMKSMFNLKLNSHTLLNWNNLKTRLSIRRKPEETLMGTHTPCGLLACKCDLRASWTMNQTPHLLCYLWK
jgi:hypothetical protein